MEDKNRKGQRERQMKQTELIRETSLLSYSYSYRVILLVPAETATGYCIIVHVGYCLLWAGRCAVLDKFRNNITSNNYKNVKLEQR